MEADGEASLPSPEAVHSASGLFNAIHIRFPRAVTNFESRWASWREVCLAQATTPASIDACTQTEEFEALKRLGPKIIPFVVFKLARDPDQNSQGVFVYNALENDPTYRVGQEEPLVSQDDLRHHSDRIVELNYQRNKIVNGLIEAWIEHHWENHVQSNSAFFTNCEIYFDLLDMGPSIIAHLMVAYLNHREGYWYELLHEIVHGRKMGAVIFQRPALFDDCSLWFNEGEHDQAPKYIPTQWDHYFKTGEMGPEVVEYFRWFEQ